MSLRSFAGLVGEVRSESFPVSYWRHLEFNLRRCERLWRHSRRPSRFHSPLLA